MSPFICHLPAQERNAVQINYEWIHTGEDRDPIPKKGTVCYVCSFWPKWAILGQCVIKAHIRVLGRLREDLWSMAPNYFSAATANFHVCGMADQSPWLVESLLEALKMESYWKARKAEQMDFYFSFNRTTLTSCIFKCLSYFYNGIALWKSPLQVLSKNRFPSSSQY